MDVLVDGELHLYGTVGTDLWGDGFTSKDVISALAQHGRTKDIVVRLNSGGGFASDGVAIYNALDSHRGHKTVYVDGIAASAASVIAMAGDEVVMRKGSIMMIHDPAGITMGSVREHEKTVEALNAIADSIAEIYAEKSGRSVEECRADMVEEIWLKPDKAVELGYATSTVDDAALEPTAFAYSLYKHAPEAVMSSAVKVSKSGKPAGKKATQAVAPIRQLKGDAMAEKEAVAPAAVEVTMSVNEAKVKADEAVKLHKDRCKTILASEEAKGRSDLANYLAFETDISAEAAIQALAKSPKPVAQAASSFAAAMSAVENPKVGPDGQLQVEDDGEIKPRMSLAERAKVQFANRN
jgi:ATP-dependent Clp protease, protease subunit